jgi:hypothetical protein
MSATWNTACPLTISSSSFSSSLRSSISRCKSRRVFKRPAERPDFGNGVGCGCGGLGRRLGNSSGRGRTVGVATDMSTARLVRVKAAASEKPPDRHRLGKCWQNFFV